jgi:hypothetical protein
VLRRSFLAMFGFLAAAAAYFLSSESWIIDKLMYRLEGKLNPPAEIPSEEQRVSAGFPEGGRKTSVEIALNSRCNSDYDDNPKHFHWGMFDRHAKLTDQQVEEVVNLAKMPCFTEKSVGIGVNGRLLTLFIQPDLSGIERDWVMIESGIQQQAVGLVCSALGVGMVFNNLGEGGTNISASRFGTVRIRIDAMKPSYGSSWWTSSVPDGVKPWKSGNLAEPARDGRVALVSILADVEAKHRGSAQLTDQHFSQMLWAAKGRTPHLYKSKPWGMTIPIWTDKTEITTVYALRDNRLSKYLNWENNRPTHSLESLGRVGEQALNQLWEAFNPHKDFIILASNDRLARGEWEVGYELLNIMVQAKALDISYVTYLLNQEQRKILERSGISGPRAVVAL